MYTLHFLEQLLEDTLKEIKGYKIPLRVFNNKYYKNLNH